VIQESMSLIKGLLTLCVFQLLRLSSILGSVMSINFRSIFFYVSIISHCSYGTEGCNPQNTWGLLTIEYGEVI